MEKITRTTPPQAETGRQPKKPNYKLRRFVATLLLGAVPAGAIGAGTHAFATRDNDNFAAANEAANFAQPVDGATGLDIEGFQFRETWEDDGHNSVNVRTSPAAIGGCPLVDIPILTSNNCAGTVNFEGAHINTDTLYLVQRQDESGNGSNGTWYGIPANQLSPEEREAMGIGNDNSEMFWVSANYSSPTTEK